MAECVEERSDGFHLLTRIDHAVSIAGEVGPEDRWADVDAVRCSALLIEAEESVAPAGQMAARAARMPHAEHVRLPRTGHLVHAADPQRYLHLVEHPPRRTAARWSRPGCPRSRRP